MDHEAERIMIYPYGMEFAPILRHICLMSGFKVTGVVSPRGWAYGGKDASIADKGDPIGIFVNDDFFAALEECDTLLVADCRPTDRFRDEIFNKILAAIEKGKNIINTLSLDSEQISIIQNECEKKGVYFRPFSKNQEGVISLHPLCKHERINTPVVFIAGVLENTSKLELQLSLRESLMNMGYRVGQIGSRHYCELMRFHSFPQFMFNPGIHEKNKILMFNQFVKNIEIKEAPDIIIIGIPGEVLPYSKEHRENYGVLAFLVSQAVEPDFSILSVLYNTYEQGYLPRLSTTVKYRLGFEPDLFILSNAQLDEMKSKEKKKKCFNNLEMSFIEREKYRHRGYGYPVYNVYNQEDCAYIADTLTNSLSSEGAMEI